MTATSSGDHVDELDPRAAQQLIDATTDRTVRRIYPQPSTQYAVWAIAWPVAMIAGYLGVRPDAPISYGLAGTIYSLALASGVVFELIYVSSRSAGVAGDSRKADRIWGISWLVLIATAAMAWAGIGRITDGAMGNLLPATLFTMAVGAAYLQGGAFWPGSRLTLLGWLLLLVAGAATLWGPVNGFLVLGIAGGASFLLGALLTRRGNRTGVASQL